MFVGNQSQVYNFIGYVLSVSLLCGKCHFQRCYCHPPMLFSVGGLAMLVVVFILVVLFK